MAFWRWRSSSRSGATPSVPEEDPSPLVLLTRGGRVSGLLTTDGRRVTDVLNQSDEVFVRVRSVEAIFAASRSSGRASEWSRDGAAGGGQETLATEDILLAIPPAHQSPRQMQIHRRTRRVELQVGPYLVEGHAHVTPGVPLDAYVARLSTRFIPLTNVNVHGPETDDLELPLETAIVNVRAIVALQALS